MIIDQQVYNGDLIHERFAYKFFRKEVSPFGNIVAFRAPMYVSDNLIDLEDTLAKDFIHSDDAINFCWEIPNMCPLGAVAFQRLFNTTIASMIGQAINKGISMNGDDIMVNDTFIGSDDKKYEQGKVSVSITYSKDNVALGHTGINIKAGKKAPGFAYSSSLTDAQVNQVMDAVVTAFNLEVKDQWIATTKIIL
jgi:hypothetical protein|tara:strand:- start:10464 stop:11045 length:582 start_codon:yes stop_codon:yes gene_type:complete